MLFLLLAISLNGCTNNSIDNTIQQQTASEVSDNHGGSLKDIYFKYIENAGNITTESNMSESKHTYSVTELWYFVCDVNYDGIEDLVVSDSSENGNGFRIYTYINNSVEILCESKMPYSSGVETMSLAKYNNKYGIFNHRDNSADEFRFSYIDTNGNPIKELDGYHIEDWIINDEKLEENEWNNIFNSIQPVTFYDYTVLGS